MKILLTHELFPPFIAGGGEVYCENLVRELMKRDIEVKVVAGAWSDSKSEIYNGINVDRVNLSPTRYSFNIKGYFALKKAAKEFKPDVIHAFTYHSAIPASLAGKKLGIPSVLSTHSIYLEDWYKYFNPFKATAYYLIERIIFSFPHNKIIANDYNAYYYLEKGLNLGKNSILIEHPINTEIFKPGKKIHDKFTIGLAITAARTKKFDNFVHLVKTIKGKHDVDFIVAGKPTEQEKKILQDIGVKYVGWFQNTEMPKFYDMADIYFGQMVAAKEAMACGCATILNEPTERLIRFHDKEVKAGAMLCGDSEEIVEKLINDKDYYKNSSKKAIDFIKENYDTPKILDKIIGVYKEILK